MLIFLEVIMKEFKDYFSKSEIVLWSSSVMVIIISFCVFDRINYMTLCASLIGVTSLIFNAKGNPFGQLLMVVFSLLYGIISYTFSYYGGKWRKQYKYKYTASSDDLKTFEPAITLILTN